MFRHRCSRHRGGFTLCSCEPCILKALLLEADLNLNAVPDLLAMGSCPSGFMTPYLSPCYHGRVNYPSGLFSKDLKSYVHKMASRMVDNTTVMIISVLTVQK